MGKDIQPKQSGAFSEGAGSLISSPRPSPDSSLEPTFSARAADSALDVLTLMASIATKPKETAFSAIRLIRAVTVGKFSAQLHEEWANYVAAGKIKAEYAETEQARTMFADTLQSLEDANFDDEQLELLRKLFLAAASETTTGRNSVLVREYIEVGRSLATGEIRVLAPYYRYLPEWQSLPKQGVGAYGVHEAMEVLRKHSGLEYAGLIERHERSLIEKGLVRQFGPERSGFAPADQKINRLTDFGFAFCEFLKGYDKLKGG